MRIGETGKKHKVSMARKGLTGSCVALVGMTAFFAIVVFYQGEIMADSEAAIVGSWKVNCANSHGMVIEFTDSGDSIEGRVKVLGRGKRFGYNVGDEIFRLQSDGSEWMGEFLWRSSNNVKLWQPIVFKMNKGKLHGKTANEYCYENMSRVE